MEYSPGANPLSDEAMQAMPPDGRPSQVGLEAMRAPEELEQLHNAIEQLEMRLSGVLRPNEPDSDMKAPGPPEEVVVPLAETVRGWNRGISAATRRIRSIDARLEL